MRILCFLVAALLSVFTTRAGAFTVTGPGPLIKQAPAAAAKYARQFEVRDATGTITMFVTAAGTMVLGAPAALSVASVFPANGATGVASGTIPTIIPNQNIEGVSISTMYILGSPASPEGCALESGAGWCFPTFSGTPGTTYTMRFLRQAVTQTQGESTSSCGPAMTDIAGVCTSTFTMAP